MKKVVSLILTAILVLGLAACAHPASGSILKSDKPRLSAPAATASDLKSLTDGNSAFALDLYQALRGTEGNLFYSPYSISLALAMTYAGAAGDTATQMADTLHFMLPPTQFHPAWNSLDLALASRGQDARGKDDKGFRLHVVNAIWGQQDFPFLSSFLDTLAQNYGAGLRVMDFIGAPEPSRVTINQWVSKMTEQRIKDLIPPGAIDTLTRLVLTNAIYFNAAWQYPFTESATANGPFTLLNGQKINVPMMHETEGLRHAKGDGYQAVELPYDGNELSMVILCPDQLDAFEAALDSQRVNSIIQSLQRGEVALTMPRFQFDSSFSLKSKLAEMGMPVAFNSQADFSGMDGKRDLSITDVIHKAFVSVDEAGTEAAAATGVIIGATAMPLEPVTITLDRPFIFLIRDNPTGTILFVGRVVNPGA
jgi:serpin B